MSSPNNCGGEEGVQPEKEKPKEKTIQEKLVEEKQLEQAMEQHMVDLVSAEEYLDHVKGIQMLPYQRQMFLDMAHSDGLIVCAK